MIDNPRNRTSPMDELDEDELFTVCLDDDGHAVQRAVRDMTVGEVIAAIDHLTAAHRHHMLPSSPNSTGRMRAGSSNSPAPPAAAVVTQVADQHVAPCFVCAWAWP